MGISVLSSEFYLLPSSSETALCLDILRRVDRAAEEWRQESSLISSIQAVVVQYLIIPAALLTVCPIAIGTDLMLQITRIAMGSALWETTHFTALIALGILLPMRVGCYLVGYRDLLFAPIDYQLVDDSTAVTSHFKQLLRVFLDLCTRVFACEDINICAFYSIRDNNPAELRRMFELFELDPNSTIARYEGNPTLLELLIAGIPEHDFGDTRLALIEVLLEHGADANVYFSGSSNGHTPLTFAVVHQDAALVSLLVQYGARADLPHSNPDTPAGTPLGLAGGLPEIEELLLNSSPVNRYFSRELLEEIDRQASPELFASVQRARNAQTPWAVFGLLEGATASDLGRAYRVTALDFHPDRHPSANPATVNRCFIALQNLRRDLQRGLLS